MLSKTFLFAVLLFSICVSAQEITVDFASGTAEMSNGGVRINVIPRDGGNTFKGTFFANATREGWQADNFTQDLKNRGLLSPNRCAGAATPTWPCVRLSRSPIAVGGREPEPRPASTSLMPPRGSASTRTTHACWS